MSQGGKNNNSSNPLPWQWRNYFLIGTRDWNAFLQQRLRPLVKGGNAVIVFPPLPLNKKSYSSSRFPILDEAAPNAALRKRLDRWRLWPSNVVYKPENKLWERVVRRLCASSGCQGELAAEGERGAPNSAEGGEESLRCTCLPEGGAPYRHAGGEHQFTIEQAVVQLSGKIKVFQINELTSIHPNCELVKLW